MLLRRAPLLLLWGLLGSVVPGGRCGSSRHSLRYSYRRVSESSRSQFFSVILLDDQPIARNHHHTSEIELLVPWMGAEEKRILVDLERMFRTDLHWLSNLGHQTEGLHTWQASLGCELREDGSKGGFLHYSHNGMDFISFDKETLRWMTAQPQAQKVKEKWDNKRWRSKRNKVYLEEMCIERMQKYLPNQTESLKKTELPEGKVTCKVVNNSLEALICQTFGFYPREIQAIWTRDGEACKYEPLHRNVVPNSDGTYYVWISIEIDPKERHRFRCHLEHEGLVLNEETESTNSKSNPWLIIGCPMAALAVIVGISAFCYFRKRRQDGYKAAPTSKRKFSSSDQGGVGRIVLGIVATVGIVIVGLLSLFLACWQRRLIYSKPMDGTEDKKK